MIYIGKLKSACRTWISKVAVVALLFGVAFMTVSCGAENARSNQWLDAPIPSLRLWQGIQTDWGESEPIAADVSGRYVLSDTMTVGFVYSGSPGPDAPSDFLGYFIFPGPGSALYFAEDGSSATVVRLDIPYRDVSPETDIFMVHININELFPDGFSGQMWGVIVEPPWPDQQVEEYHGKRIDVIYTPA